MQVEINNKQATNKKTPLKVDDALSIILKNIQPVNTEKIALGKCLGRVLGESVTMGSGVVPASHLVIPSGTLLASNHFGILANFNKTYLKVMRKPKIAVLSIDNANTYAVITQIRKCGCNPKLITIPKEKPESLKEKIKRSLDCDLILAFGGANRGNDDLIKFTLLKMGTDIKFCEVAMEPARPLIFGLIREIPVIGLSGDLIAEAITFEVFVRPTILRMLGVRHELRKEVDAVLEETLHKKIGTRYYLLGNTRWDEGLYFTRTIEALDKITLKSLTFANSLIILPEETDIVERGIRVLVRFLD